MLLLQKNDHVLKKTLQEKFFSHSELPFSVRLRVFQLEVLQNSKSPFT